MPKKGKAKGGAKKGGAKAAKAVEVDLNPFSSVFNDPAQVPLSPQPWMDQDPILHVQPPMCYP